MKNLVAAVFDFAVAVAVALILTLNPLGTRHFDALQKMDQKQVCLSVASFACFPFFVMQQNVMGLPITRRASLRSPFVCLLYFGEAK